MLAGVEGRPGLWLALALFVVIRPVATMLTLAMTPLSGPQRAFIAWFGVRGVGSIYYLAYALSHGLSGATGRMMADATLVVVATSIVLHGVSVTPVMKRYAARAARLLVDYAIEHLGAKRVEAEVDPRNTASLRVATRAGLRREGIRRVEPGMADAAESSGGSSVELGSP